jgi:hypothetical protein
MPSTATITAFYSFTANTKARASQVNANFDVFRGHICPVSPSAQAFVNNTYDLGSTEYRWRDGYVRSLDFLTNTTTGNALTISGETTSSTPAFVHKVGGTEKFRVSSLGYSGSNVTVMGLTTNATKPHVAYRSVSNYAPGGTSAGYNIAGSTITITTLGNPIEIFLSGFAVLSGHSVLSNIISSNFAVICEETTGSTGISQNLSLTWGTFQANATTSFEGAVSGHSLFAVPAGTYNFYVQIGNIVNSTYSITSNIVLAAREL